MGNERVFFFFFFFFFFILFFFRSFSFFLPLCFVAASPGFDDKGETHPTRWENWNGETMQIDGFTSSQQPFDPVLMPSNRYDKCHRFARLIVCISNVSAFVLFFSVHFVNGFYSRTVYSFELKPVRFGSKGGMLDMPTQQQNDIFTITTATITGSVHCAVCHQHFHGAFHRIIITSLYASIQQYIWLWFWCQSSHYEWQSIEIRDGALKSTPAKCPL